MAHVEACREVQSDPNSLVVFGAVGDMSQRNHVCLVVHEVVAELHKGLEILVPCRLRDVLKSVGN